MPVPSRGSDLADPRPPPADRRTSAGGDVRVGSALLLLAFLAVGLRRPGLDFLPGAGTPSGSGFTEVLAWILVPLSCCAGLLLLAAVGWRRRRAKDDPDDDEDDEDSGPGWLTVLVGRLAGLLALATVGVAVWLLVRGGSPDDTETVQPPPGPGVLDRPAGGPDTSGDSATAYDVLLIAAVAAAGLFLVAGAVAIARARARARSADTLQDGQSGSDVLAEAVEAGRRALRREDDDRAAIIACYVAMEDAFARHGVARDRAETAGEHLRRATEAGLVGTDAVRELVAVFGRARFSDRPIRAGDRASVERVLDEVRTTLGEPV